MSLFKRKDSPYWWVKFSHDGRRIQQSTGTSDRAKAQEYHDKLKASLWDEARLGVFREEVPYLLLARGPLCFSFACCHHPYLDVTPT